MKTVSFLQVSEQKLNWVAAQIRPNMLNKVCAHLTNQSFSYFAPSRMETIRSGNGFKQVSRLLFPGYVFVRCQLASGDVKSLNATYGISRIVRGLGDGPGIIPDGFIDALMQACDGQSQNSPSDIPEKGAHVRMIDGPFVGLAGEVLSADSNGRLRVLFEVMAGTHTLSVSANRIERLNR